MAFTYIAEYQQASNASEFLSQIYTHLSASNWTLVANRDSDGYRIYKPDSYYLFQEYCKVGKDYINNIFSNILCYWNGSTNTAIGNIFSFYLSFPIYYSFYGNKDTWIVTAKNTQLLLGMLKFVPYINPVVATVTQSTGTGSNVTVYVNDSSNLVVNSYYSIHSGSSVGRNHVKVVSKPSQNSVVLNDLDASYPSGSVISSSPTIYVSLCGGTLDFYTTFFLFNVTLPSSNSNTNGNYLNIYPIDVSHIMGTPDFGNIILNEALLVKNASSSGIIPVATLSEKMYLISSNTYLSRSISDGGVLDLGTTYTGTPTSTSTSTLSDTSKSWATNELSNKYLILNTSNFQYIRKIISNTSNTITFAPSFSSAPTVQSYKVCEKALRQLYNNSYSYQPAYLLVEYQT